MPTRADAIEFLNRNAISIFGDDVGTLVYVGHRHDTHPWWHTMLAPLVRADKLIVVDIFEKNLASANHITKHLVLGDVLDPKTIGAGSGLVFWDEGPEHVTREQFMPWPRMMLDLGWSVLTSCPWGMQMQGAEDGNPHEEHHWGPMPEDMIEAGLEVKTFGSRPFPDDHGNLIAWKRHE